MPHQSKRLIHYGLAILTAAVAAGCKSDGTGTDDGEIAISLNPTSATVAQGGNTTVAGTLTRSGGFTGTVQFGVTGNPTGVTAAVSNEVTTGLVTTATFTITVGAAVTPGVYPLVVSGTGSGVTTATANFALTVTAPAPSYTLSLTSAALSIAAGTSTPTTTVNVNRVNFTGDVTLSVGNLPAGVTAAFAPNPATQNTSVLTLTVGAGVTPGVYNLTVNGTGTPGNQSTPLTLTVTAAAPTPAYTLSLTSAALTIPQGSNAPTTTVNVNRTNFTGDVTLSVTGLPTGVTAAFAPNPATLGTSVLTLTVGAATVPGVYNLTVNGAASIGNQQTPLTLTVSVVGDFTISTVPPATVNVTQGTSSDVAINVQRTGGHTNNITFSVTGLVAGLTANLNPVTTGGNTATLTLTASAGLAPGAYPIVVRANSPGLAEKTSNLSVNVVASGGSGNVTVSFAACTVANRAAWLAYQDGNGAWVRVTGVADVYQFNITQSKGGFAYVVLGTGTSTINVYYFTQAELIAGQFSLCGTTPTGKTVNGTIANLPVGFLGNASFGGGTTSAFVNGPFQLTNVLDGSMDVVGYARAIGGPGASDRMFLARGLNPANGGSIGTVDYTGAGSFAPAAATMTLVGAVGGETVAHSMFYYTGAACVAAPLYSASPVTPPTFTAYGNTGAPATDFNNISVIAINGSTAFRATSESFHTFAARNVTLPSALGTVTASDAGGPYKRLMVVTTLPADLNSSVVATYTDNTVTGKAGTIIASAGWLGGLAVSLTLPDFSALAGWSNAWAPATGDNLTWSFSGATASLTSICQEGARIASSTKTGTI